jgi:hypothetical protein
MGKTQKYPIMAIPEQGAAAIPFFAICRLHFNLQPNRSDAPIFIMASHTHLAYRLWWQPSKERNND